MSENENAVNIQLSPLDRKVLQVLTESSDRVMSRESIARQVGLDAKSARRVDASLVSIRRALGPEALVTVRQRGWMLTIAALQIVNILLETMN